MESNSLAIQVLFMNAQPQPSPRARSTSANSNLVDAMKAEAEASRLLEHYQSQIDRAIAVGAEQASYVWHAQEGREAEVRVYFVMDADILILAGQVTQVDNREPSIQERVELESAFDAEMAAFGDLWQDVASMIWANR